ncbi:MAG: Ig-like domain-containing protein, partial [Krumholzibacteria bacterium]|nr:Ig-like domain-containing protein [Candidatus Krumholzibacteria bacterium]
DTSGNALGADVVWTFTTEDIDLEAPYVVEREPLPGATEVMTAAAVRAVFNEALDPATVNGSTFTLTPAGGLPVAAVVGWDGATLTASLVPGAELEYATTYEARLTTAVADLAGNPLAGDEVWTFTTRLVAPVCITTTTTADFAAGTPDGVMVAERDNGLNSGQLRLQAAVSDLFPGPDPDPQWVITRSLGPSITDGVMDAQGYSSGLPVTSSGHIETAVGGNVTCEMRTQFRAGSNFASMGLQSDSAEPEQATYFSTFGTGDDPVTMIHTVVRDTSGYTAVGVPTAVTLDEWHDFRIVHLPGAVEFYVDGVLVDTRTGVGFTLPLRFAFYKSGGSATPLLVDWARITPYTTDEGTFVSAVHDAGGPGTAWTELLWTGETPAGTGVAYETRTGETAEPDSSWSAWDAVSGFTVASPPGRYAQFRTTLTSGDLAVSPVVDHVQLCYTPALEDSTAPLVVVTEPAADAVLVAVDLPVTVTFNEPIDPLTLTTASFTLTPDGGTAVAATVALDSTGTLATLTPDSLLAYGTVYGGLLTTAIADTSGNFLAADYAWSFTTAAAPDTTAPTVVATEPAADAVDVAVALPITATFNKPIDPATLTVASFTLTPDGGAAVAATVALDSTGTLAILTPDTLLAYGTLYGGLLTTAIADTSGIFLAADYAWSFTTAAAPDTTAPTVVATEPAADAVLVAVDLPVTATFSEPIDPATLTVASFTLTPDGGAAVTATVALDSTGTVATLTPEARLAFGTVYTATLAVAITDTSGTPLAEDYAWIFTTATGLSAVGPHDLPALTALQPNYPNPFNPRTTVAFDLAREGTVRLRIYSVDGRLVRTLVSQSMPAGRHSVVWNGDDDHGRNVATGVYLLRMETPDRAQTRKMLLMQ